MANHKKPEDVKTVRLKKHEHVYGGYHPQRADKAATGLATLTSFAAGFFGGMLTQVVREKKTS